MFDHYVFALPTAEGKAEFKSLKVDPVSHHDFNEFDVRQLLETYGILRYDIVAAKTEEDAIQVVQDNGVDADKRAAKSFKAEKFRDAEKIVRPFDDFIKLNHAYYIDLDAHTHNLGEDIKNLPAGAVPIDIHHDPIGIIEDFQETHKAIRFGIDAKFRKADDKMELVPAGSLMILMGDNHRDIGSYEFRPQLAQHIIRGEQNLNTPNGSSAQSLVA